jgi:DNA topoisomerase-1
MAAKNLVIVESPAKAKTIEKFLGSDFMVKSSFGHIRDLPKKGISIDVDDNFKPTYEIPTDKKKVVADLKKSAKGLTVWLASDEDREGEAIAWHLCHALGIKPEDTKRIVFHEITKTAIEAAVKNPRTVNQQLVDAQQARRILDRLVGYQLSPVLWKKVRPGLSAGRVQSVAVRLIVEREREIKAFESASSYKLSGTFHSGTEDFDGDLNKSLEDKAATEQFLKEIASAEYKVESINKKPGSRNPSAPFTTSTLQQEASRKLGFSVRQTMTLAQRLYENGHITYMRTDSTTLSGQAVASAEAFIKKEYGDDFHQVRQFKTKSSSAQEAHEAIRPTSFTKLKAGDDSGQEKLYNLIWRRALASQMAPAVVDKTDVKISISGKTEYFSAKGEILKFAGFIKAYGGGKDDSILPDLVEGQVVKNQQVVATESFSRPPARYSEASLVRKLEELGIGRPSTYAPTIGTVQTRGYVEKSDLEGNTRNVTTLTLKSGNVEQEDTDTNYGADKNKLLPTAVAGVTTDFLVKYFAPVVDYDFTAKAEAGFDLVADGKESWEKMLGNFYKDFHPLIDKVEGVSREETSQARRLGDDPKSGKPIIARFGRFGPMLQRGETGTKDDGTEKPDFAPMPEGVDLEDITFEQALEMFKLPRIVGKTEEGEDIKANIGRFGPYIQIGKLYVSIKPLDPFKITEKESLELYAEKLKKEAEKHIATFDNGLQILNGPYGPYITNGKKNARIAKDADPTKITAEEAKKIHDAAPDKKRKFKRKTTTKKKK